MTVNLAIQEVMASSDHSYVSDDSNASFEKVNASECSFGSNKPNRKTSSTTTAISFSTSVSQDEKWIWSGEVFEAFDNSNSSLDDPFGDDDLETAIETVDDDDDLPTAIETQEDDDLLETAIETPSELDLSTNTAIATEEDLEHALEESLDDSFVTADDDKSSNGSDFSVISEFDEDELLCSTRSGSSLELVTALETSTATALETSTVLEASTATALEDSTVTALETSTDALEVSTATALEESTVTAVDQEDSTALEGSTATAQLEESTATALEDSTATALEESTATGLDLDSSSDYSLVSSIDYAIDTCQDESVVTALEESTATALEESTVQEETSAAQLEESTATAVEESTATALEDSTATALEDSTVTALEESTATALEDSTATALEESTATALEESTLTALEDSTATALDNSTATAQLDDSLAATQLEDSTATALEDSTASSLDESTATALDDSALAALDESVFTDTPLDDSTTTAILTEEERRQQFVNHLHRDAPEMDETQSLNSSVTGSLSSDDSLSNMPDDLDDSDCCDEDCSCDEHNSCGCHEDCSCDEDCDEEEELEDEDVSDEESICDEDEEEEIEEEICQESVQEEEVPEHDQVQEAGQPAQLESQQGQACPEGSRPCNQTEQLFYNCGCDTLVKKERDIAIKSLEDEKQAIVARRSNVTLPEDGIYENYRLCLESMEYALRATPNHVGLLQVLKLITEIKSTVEKMESILNKAEQEEAAKKENEVIEVAGKHKVYYAEPWMVSDIEDDSEDDVTDEEELDSDDDVTSEDSTSDDSSTEATDHTTSGEELSEYVSTGDDSQVSSDGSVAPSVDDNKEVRTYQCEFCDKCICADCGEIIEDEEDKKETAVETPVMKSLSEDKSLSPVVLKAVLATYETLSKFKKIIIVTQKMHSDLNVAPIIKKYETIVEPNVEELKTLVKEEGMFFLTKLNYEINECMERLEAEAGPELWKMITDNVAITPESRLSDALLASSREERIRFYQELIEGDFNNFFQLPIGTIQNMIN